MFPTDLTSPEALRDLVVMLCVLMLWVGTAIVARSTFQ